MQRIRLTEKRYPMIKAFQDAKKTGVLSVNINAQWHKVPEDYNDETILGIAERVDIDNIDMYSKEYLSTMNAIGHKVLTPETLSAISPFSGVLILNPTYIFYIVSKASEDELRIITLTFIGNTLHVAGRLSLIISQQDKLSSGLAKPNLLDGYASDAFAEMHGSEDAAIIRASAEPLKHNLFSRFYSKVDKVVITDKKSNLFNCHYKNDLPKNVTLYDSRELYNIKKQTSSFVRGHWRFQACGEGMKDRKLIFIDPYIKGGFDEGKQDAA